MMPLEKAFCSISEAMRSHHPLVHHITNYVTAGFCADAALAIGASPMMADEEGEMPAISQLSDALVLNLGTMNERTYGAMKKALVGTAACGRPILLDPVGVMSSSFRFASDWGHHGHQGQQCRRKGPPFLAGRRGKGRGFPF